MADRFMIRPLGGLTALCLLASPAAAAPPSDGRDAFGVAMGAPIARVPGAQAFAPGWYHVPAPPRPDPRFDKVAVQAFARTGVCVVQAVGAEITADPDGAKIRAAIDRLAEDFSAAGSLESLFPVLLFAASLFAGAASSLSVALALVFALAFAPDSFFTSFESAGFFSSSAPCAPGAQKDAAKSSATRATAWRIDKPNGLRITTPADRVVCSLATDCDAQIKAGSCNNHT